MEAYCAGNQSILEERTDEIDTLEHEADKLKQKIRASIPSSVRLPVNKKDLLSFLKQQDSIADYAQTAAYWMTLRSCEDIPEEIKEGFLELMNTSLKTARLYDELAGALYKLLATSFSKEEIKETMTIILKSKDWNMMWMCLKLLSQKKDLRKRRHYRRCRCLPPDRTC